jgi:hypothetical protein
MSEQGPGQWRKARAARQPVPILWSLQIHDATADPALRTAACLWHPSLF